MNGINVDGLADGPIDESMRPMNKLVGPLLTDMYQISMTYAYWKSGQAKHRAVYDLFFRKNPFHGEFTVFMGLEEVLRFVATFRFHDEDVAYIRTLLPQAPPEFFTWLITLDCSEVQIFACPEGTLVFPRVPLIKVKGPLAVCQLIETTLLNLVNYASLVATNAARMRLAAGKGKTILEFGLRRAQGPDGALSASRYTYAGGVDGTSNVLAAKLFGIPCRGTHAHAYVNTFSSLSDLHDRGITLFGTTEREENFVQKVVDARNELGFTSSHVGELTAFISYAQAFPQAFLCLVDTYETLQSGVPNFLSVAVALRRLGYRPLGIRLDSGDLAYLSRMARALFERTAKTTGFEEFKRLTIVASNDINEQTILSLNSQGHEIDSFGIGTHLVTCQSQPALGCVYKLVEVDGKSCIKLSEEVSKVSIPACKVPYRLVSSAGTPLLDILVQEHEKPPQVGSRIMCRHPFDEVKRVYVTPSKVVSLHRLWWDGKLLEPLPHIEQIRAHVQTELASMREDILRPLNPTPYKVSLSEDLYAFVHNLWLENAPVRELS
mmetsp:Transcript_12773/g.20856  ORF Transcript_12773/g.20856 Transcript_12773/m.20856 type:complete len:549 (+) Transcript_12773:177-1823(+)|eukprot:CAMPEP_0184648920 /NCGR_PEP_ID=MMETSP0308-20130426/6166_1 /TAXON_ID=38269 /ORGANISM="Gloeochaete witrockiana, Strain SAG 46.84" /LENGTH=548 /DNA_ID=CAMNT_0027081215 /DNA_START=37 /DNA_END=1683 /DNA_ORIENTATION=+